MRPAPAFLVLFLAACAGSPGLPITKSPAEPAAAEPAAAESPPTVPGPAPTGEGGAPPGDSAAIWIPPLDISWQWQLTGEVDRSVDAQVFDLDLFETGAQLVSELHASGRRVICYISVGSWEDWRPDADQFPESVIGAAYSGWPGERWLDIRQIEALAPILMARFDQCAAKGFDGLEPDNIDGYTNATGFPIRAQDQLAFNRWLADQAHARGLSIGLKNDPDQVAELLPYFDWALTEDCFAEGWCVEFAPFVEAGKPVFAAEYTDNSISLPEICPQAAQLGFNLILKDRELDALRSSC